jgi:response regulator of citrate/malate metabolism
VTQPIRVLVVEDEPFIAEAHGEYVQRVNGFALVGIALSGQQAMQLLKTTGVDLILLDFNLPDMHGLDLCRTLRSSRFEVDIIAVTSTRDLSAVRAAVSLGVVQYLLKPFTWQALQDKLQRYQQYRVQTLSEPSGEQSDIDRAFTALRGAITATLPSGLTDETRDRVIHVLRDGPALSALEVAERCKLSRVTARRYLEHLTDSGVLMRRQRHGGSGRPELEYLWVQ